MASTSIDNSPIIRVVQTDVNGNPVYASGSVTNVVTDTQTLVASGTTAHVPVFGLTGTVEVLRLWGVVTTDLGPNHTAAGWRLNDQTAQVDITLAAGSVMSAFKAGSLIYKKGLVATAATVVNNSAGRANESTANLDDFSRIILTKKTAATTNIEYNYTTSDTPTSGVIQFFCEYRPISADGALTPL